MTGMAAPLYLANYPSFSVDDRSALAALVDRVARPGCRILEIGSWLGAGSTRTIIERIRTLDGARLYCVDTWKGSANVQRHAEIVRDYDVQATFRHNVEIAGGSDCIRQIVMPSAEAAYLVSDHVFDLVFIDGDHAYAHTRDDIARWHPKVKRGGILCGHDCETRLNDSLRQRIMDARNEDCIAGDGTVFAAIHPGVVLAVHEAFGSSAHLWAEQPIEHEDGTSGRATLWDVAC